MNDDLLLMVGAAVILAFFILNSNSTINDTKRSIADSEYVETGVALAQSLIDEIKTKNFDQNTPVGIAVTSPSSLTTIGSLGKDPGEVVPNPDILSTSSNTFSSATNFNDVDDYKDYNRRIDTPRLGQYILKVYELVYADTTDPSTNALPGSPTFCKRITINVYNHPYIDSTKTKITLSFAFTY